MKMESYGWGDICGVRTIGMWMQTTAQISTTEAGMTSRGPTRKFSSRRAWGVLLLHVAAVGSAGCEPNVFEASERDLPEEGSRERESCPHLRATLRVYTRASRVVPHVEVTNMTTSVLKAGNMSDPEEQTMWEVHRGGNKVVFLGWRYAARALPPKSLPSSSRGSDSRSTRI